MDEGRQQRVAAQVELKIRMRNCVHRKMNGEDCRKCPQLWHGRCTLGEFREEVRCQKRKSDPTL